MTTKCRRSDAAIRRHNAGIRDLDKDDDNEGIADAGHDDVTTAFGSPTETGNTASHSTDETGVTPVHATIWSAETIADTGRHRDNAG